LLHNCKAYGYGYWKKDSTLSQFQSAFFFFFSSHLVFNDKEGAERTMETFHTKTPIVSHLVAGIAKVAGDDEFAKKCWDGGNSSLNALPVV
jgi:hypothetical protein